MNYPIFERPSDEKLKRLSKLIDGCETLGQAQTLARSLLVEVHCASHFVDQAMTQVIRRDPAVLETALKWGVPEAKPVQRIAVAKDCEVQR